LVCPTTDKSNRRAVSANNWSIPASSVCNKCDCAPQVELGRLLDRQIAGLRTLQDFVDIGRRSLVHVLVARAKRHQSARHHQLAQELQSLALRSRAIELKPVMLPPGRAKLGTTPLPTGSPTATITNGTDMVARLTARAAGVPAVTITSTFAVRSSVTSLGNR